MFLDDEDNKNYMLAPENLEFKGPTRRNNQYCVWLDISSTGGMGIMWNY